MKYTVMFDGPGASIHIRGVEAPGPIQAAQETWDRMQVTWQILVRQVTVREED